VDVENKEKARVPLHELVLAWPLPKGSAEDEHEKGFGNWHFYIGSGLGCHSRWRTDKITMHQ
jgi:hypothetical protein